MGKNYLIGIGGTGARVVEAVVHCCAAGLGPDELTVFLVDPDEGNGNLSRTKSLVTQYQASRRAYTQRSGDHVPLFRTRLRTPETLVWSIFDEKNSTLSRFVNLDNLRENAEDRPLADFISVLFTREELDTELNEGFRGHPSIGAVVMASPDPQHEPWKTFWDDVAACQAPHEARVFLVGSIFGGTGAAGVPTFGAREMIKANPSALVDDGTSKVLLGGALVLPYFTFESPEAPPTSADGAPEMYVTPADFPIATQAALQFYNEKDLGFDQMYLLGDSLAQRVGRFSHGNQGQENRPHYIVLVSALAAFDFFGQPEVPPGSEPEYFYACRDGRPVDWAGLPGTRDAGRLAQHQAEVKLALCAMTAFAYVMATEGAAVLDTPHDQVKDAWYRRNFSFNPRRPEDAGLDPRQHTQRAAIETVERFGEQFLHWIAALDEDSGDARLVDRRRLFADSASDSGEEEGEARLLPPREHLAAIGEFVKGTRRAPDFAAFLDTLRDVRIDSAAMSPANRWINLFYEAAQEFCASGYNIPLAGRAR
jgi:hypothetical protein